MEDSLVPIVTVKGLLNVYGLYGASPYTDWVRPRTLLLLARGRALGTSAQLLNVGGWPESERSGRASLSLYEPVLGYASLWGRRTQVRIKRRVQSLIQTSTILYATSSLNLNSSLILHGLFLDDA